MEENVNNVEQEVQVGRKNKVGVLKNIEEQYYPQIFKIIKKGLKIKSYCGKITYIISK